MEKNKVNLEIAKKLKELKVEQESEFYWVSHLCNDKMTGDFSIMSQEEMGGDSSYEIYGKTYSAFTVGELGEGLPALIKTKEESGEVQWNLKITKLHERKNGDSIWSIYYQADDRYSKNWGALNDAIVDTEANARGKMRICLIKNKLMEIKK